MTLTVTFDLEDNRRSPAQQERFAAMTERFLAFLAERDVKATFFIVGEIARSHPELVRRVADARHEIALHGLRHVTLGDVGPGHLGAELAEGRALLEDAGGQPVAGFRAPIFSLTPATGWAVDVLGQAGFRYSSSVLPARSPLHGWPGAPLGPWRWGNGLLELPCPVGGPARAQLPFLGGVYLRYLPMPAIRRFLASLEESAVAWSYLHPYDLDPDEPFFVLPHAGWLTSRILHARRGATLGRLAAVIDVAGGTARPLCEIAEGLAAREDLPRVQIA